MIDWRRYLDTGVFEDDSVPAFFRSCAWLTEAEAVSEIEAAGLRVVRLQGMDGPAPGTGQESLEGADQVLVDQWADIALQLGATPEGRATADHLLVVADRSRPE